MVWQSGADISSPEFLDAELQSRRISDSATPMSAAIPCTRATAQRIALRTIRCKRFASTETVAVDAAPTTAPLPPAKREQRLPSREDLSQRLHRALYPEYYGENGQPINGPLRGYRRKQPTKPISSKWEAVMKQKNVNHGLSTPTLSTTPNCFPFEQVR